MSSRITASGDDGDGPSDAEIEAGLRAGQPDAWERVLAARPALQRGEIGGRWFVPEPKREVLADGTERVVHSFGWVEYDDATTQLVGDLGRIGAIVPFGWPTWDGIGRYPKGTGLTDAPVADAVRLSTAVVRSDRFSEGSLLATLEDGTLSRIVDRLCTWWEREFHSPPPR